MDRATFERLHPGMFFLVPGEEAALTRYLRGLGVLAADEDVVGATKAGEGNMNCTVRAETGRRSLIVKQSRPWVEKYPQFEAPWDRALVEAEFYRQTAGEPALRSRMPGLLTADAEARLLVLEDLGPSADYTSLYGRRALEDEVLDELADFLSALHAAFADSTGPELLANREMRALNSEHIYFIPLDAERCPDLEAIQPGLRALAAPLQASDALRAEASRLARDVYLADGPCLLHGDFFPGSILRCPSGPKVIDPEFAFFGRPEFDGAVFLAHLALAGQPARLRNRFLARYQPPPDFDLELLLQLAGVEIIRRLIGYAQLPLECGLRQKSDLLEQAWQLVLCPDVRWLGGVRS